MNEQLVNEREIAPQATAGRIQAQAGQSTGVQKGVSSASVHPNRQAAGVDGQSPLKIRGSADELMAEDEAASLPDSDIAAGAEQPAADVPAAPATAVTPAAEMAAPAAAEGAATTSAAGSTSAAGTAAAGGGAAAAASAGIPVWAYAAGGVAVLGAAGGGGGGAAAPAAPSDTTPPTAPTVQTVTVNHTKVAQGTGTDFSVALTNVPSDAATVQVELLGGTTPIVLTRTAGTNTYTAAGVADGTYTVKVTYTDAANNTSSYTSPVIVRDTTAVAPTVALATDSGASATDGLTNVATLAAPGLVEAGATVQYSIDNGTTWSATAPVPTVDGAYTVLIRQTDAAGNISASGSTTFTLDTTAPVAPTLSMLDGTAAGGSTRNGAVSVSAEPGASIAYSTDGGTTWTNLAAGSTTIPSPNTLGAHTVTVKQTDAAGNAGTLTSSISFSLTAAGLAPTVSLVTDTGSSAADLITNAAALNVSAAVGTDPASTTVEYSADGLAWSITPPTWAEGTNTVWVRLNDLTQPNNLGATLPQTFTFTLDTVAAAPTVALATDSGASATDGLTNVATLAAPGLVEAGATVQYSIDNGTTWSATAPVPTVDGAYTVLIRQTDTAGNLSANGSTTFTLDTTAPAVVMGSNLVMDSGVNGDRLTNTAMVSLSVDDPHLDHLAYSYTLVDINGVTHISNPLTLAAAAGAASIVVGAPATAKDFVLPAPTAADFPTLPAGSSLDGGYTLTAAAVDAAGNSTPVKDVAQPGVDLSFTLDTTNAPLTLTPTAIKMMAGQMLNGFITDGSVVVNATGGDLNNPNAPAQLFYLITDGAGNVLNTPTNVASGSSWAMGDALTMNLDLSALVGIYGATPGAGLTVQMTQVDAAGNGVDPITAFAAGTPLQNVATVHLTIDTLAADPIARPDTFTISNSGNRLVTGLTSLAYLSPSEDGGTVQYFDAFWNGMALVPGVPIPKPTTITWLDQATGQPAAGVQDNMALTPFVSNFFVQQTDALGNMSAPIQLTAEIDNVAPVLYNSVTNPNPGVISISDTVSGAILAVDDPAWTPATGGAAIVHNSLLTITPQALELVQPAVQFSLDGGTTFHSMAEYVPVAGVQSLLIQETDTAGNTATSAISFDLQGYSTDPANLGAFVAGSTGIATLPTINWAAIDNGLSTTDHIFSGGTGIMSVTPSTLGGTISYSMDGGMTWAPAVANANGTAYDIQLLGTSAMPGLQTLTIREDVPNNVTMFDDHSANVSVQYMWEDVAPVTLFPAQPLQAQLFEPAVGNATASFVVLISEPTFSGFSTAAYVKAPMDLGGATLSPLTGAPASSYTVNDGTNPTLSHFSMDGQWHLGPRGDGTWLIEYQFTEQVAGSFAGAASAGTLAPSLTLNIESVTGALSGPTTLDFSVNARSAFEPWQVVHLP